MKHILKQKEDTEEYQAMSAIKPGMKLYGYCGGLFGRDSHGEKTVVDVHKDHLIVTENGHTIVSKYITGNTFSYVQLIKDSNEALEANNF
jgi:hypothetical protein